MPEFLFNVAASISGVQNVIGALIVAIIAFGLFARRWHKRRLAEGKPGVQTWHWLIGGIAVTWIGVTVLSASAVIMVWRGELFASPTVAAASAPSEDGKPLKWFYNISMEGGPLIGRNVFSMTFPGWNASQKEVQLKSASIRSAIDGTELPLEIVAGNEIVPINSINLIPPGAPIKLVAKFNLPTGLPAKEFLGTWSKFNLVVADDTADYRVPFNEGNIQVFFPGLVGPHVTKKSDAGK
jgi:hypothetical protein